MLGFMSCLIVKSVIQHLQPLVHVYVRKGLPLRDQEIAVQDMCMHSTNNGIMVYLMQQEFSCRRRMRN